MKIRFFFRFCCFVSKKSKKKRTFGDLIFDRKNNNKENFLFLLENDGTENYIE